MLEGNGYSYSGWFYNHCYINGVTTIGGHREGKMAINFSDGGLYSVTGGFMEFGGIGAGEIWCSFTKTLEITDHINGYQANF